MTIAGSDSGGGAGIQADLKTFAAHDVYGLCAITAITAQNTLTVAAVLELEPELVVAQIDAVIADLGVDAIKLGMLANAAIVRAVATAIRDADVPVVLDPVMVAKSGARLLDDEGVAVLRRELLPLATLVTPNIPELAALAGLTVGSTAERDAASSTLVGEGVAVLLKGGHLEGEEVEDVLWSAGERIVYRHPRVATRHTHGTGCTLSSAVTARLARGESLAEAVGGAIGYVHGALLAAPGLGGGAGPLDHLYRLREGRIA